MGRGHRETVSSVAPWGGGDRERDATETGAALHEAESRIGFSRLAIVTPLSISGSAASQARVPVAKASPGGFVDLDERIGSGHGVVLVRAPFEVFEPLASHVSRRLRTAGLLPVEG